MKSGEPIRFRIKPNTYPIPEELGIQESYSTYLDREISKVKQELVEVKTLLRRVKIGQRRKDAQSSATCPMTYCDQCGGSYPERMCRPYQLDTSWPEINLCAYCRRLLESVREPPSAYRRWFPNRFDEWGQVKSP